MYNLPRIVINPPSLQGDIVCDYLDGNVLFGHNRDRKVSFDVVTSLIRVGVVPTVQREVNREADVIADDGLSMDEWRKLIGQYRTTGHISSVDQLSDLQLRFVVTLANHQVNGDQVTKGLKAQGIHLDVKFQESFLGGWNIQNVEGRILDLEDVLRMIPS